MMDNVSKEMWEIVLNTLPFELTIIDDNNRILYFNREGKRIFVRPQSIIGKSIDDCH